MTSDYYIQLARTGLRMPVGTDLVLHERNDREAILLDGERLGVVVREAAERYKTLLAFPLMDLAVEKHAIATKLSVAEAAIEIWHLTGALDDDDVDAVVKALTESPTPRMVATCDAISYIAKQTDLLPVGMSIGPFSLMTKLVTDPITPVYLAGDGLTAEDEDEIAVVESALRLCEKVIEVSLRAQAAAGAKAVFVCEPAANQAFFSPIQLANGSDVFERYVLEPNRRLCAVLDELGVDLIFHDCGELTDDMVRAFGELHPKILSLGSSRVLWNDAALIPKDVVLYGNLPSKRFYSDELVSAAQVATMANELVAKMAAADHPFILGSECDVLAVVGSEDKIRAKVSAFLAQA